MARDDILETSSSDSHGSNDPERRRSALCGSRRPFPGETGASPPTLSYSSLFRDDRERQTGVPDLADRSDRLSGELGRSERGEPHGPKRRHADFRALQRAVWASESWLWRPATESPENTRNSFPARGKKDASTKRSRIGRPYIVTVRDERLHAGAGDSRRGALFFKAMGRVRRPRDWAIFAYHCGPGVRRRNGWN